MSAVQSPQGISAALLLEFQTCFDSLWSRPTDVPTVAETRKHLLDELAAKVIPAVWDVWRREIPAAKESAVARQVKRGIRQSFNTLRLRNGLALWFELRRIPHYWEAPVAEKEPENLSAHQRQMYRLTAAFIALSIRNNLEDFHIAYTSDEHMPQLNRAIRNAVYGVLLANPGHTYNISLPAQTFIQAAVMGLDDAELPPVAGD